MTKRNSVARDLRTPKYRMRVVRDKKRAADKRACREPAADRLYRHAIDRALGYDHDDIN